MNSWKRWFSFGASDLGIDLGTANTLVYDRDRGLLLDEPSIVALNNTTGKVEAVGHEAKLMVGRTPANIIAVKPLKDGVIADFELTEVILKHFLDKVGRRGRRFGSRIVICVPTRTTQVERNAVRESALKAKTREVYIVEEPIAAALGSNLPISEPRGSMIVDIGGGTTEIAVISLGGIVSSASVRVAGNHFDGAIAQYIRRKYNLLIGEQTAERVKIEVGSAGPLPEPLVSVVKGRDLVKGIPRTIEITDSEVREAFSDSVDSIIYSIRLALEKTPPDLSGDIIESGIVLSGGGALLKGLASRIQDEIGIHTVLAESPLTSVAFGAGRLFQDDRLLRRVCLFEA